MSQSNEKVGWGEKLINWANAFFLLVMVLVILLQVIARYAFNHALPWPEELGRFLFAWIVFLGTVSVIQADEMLNLDLVYRYIPKGAAAFLRLLVSLIVFAFLLVMLKGGYELMIRQASQRSVGLDIPMGVVYFVIPFGTLLMALIMFLRILRMSRNLFAPKSGSQGGPRP
jgi:TRAP-type C4-dicarboxylate transport system permease small subunit